MHIDAAYRRDRRFVPRYVTIFVRMMEIRPRSKIRSRNTEDGVEISVRRGATGGFTPLLSNRFPIEPENGVEHALRDNIEYKKKKNNKNDETREICSRTLHPLIALQRIVVHRIIKLRRVILRNLDRWWKIEATTRVESASIAAIGVRFLRRFYPIPLFPLHPLESKDSRFLRSFDLWQGKFSSGTVASVESRR